MSNTGHALSREEMVRTLTAYSGITTAAGAVVGVRGTTLIDSNLIGSNDFISGKTVLIMSGDAKYEDKGALSFAPLTGTITLRGTGVSAQIVAGTIFKILNISSVEVDVANIQEDLGDMADAATSDDMSDILTTSALAKLRLILNRLSPDAFSATIHAGARTSLDTMLAEMAKYFVADGGGFDLKINNGVNRDNLNLIMRDFFTVIGILNTSIWQPTIGGGTQATVVAAVQALANYWAPLGAGLDIKINNGVNRDDLKNILKDYFAVLGISDTSIWQPVIAGGARTTVVAAIQALANLWTPPGEGLDFKINNGTNKNSLKEILQDFFTMVGCLDTSVFNPSIDGSARTTFDDAWTALAALLGTKATAAAEGAVTSDDSMVAYIKQLVTLLLNGTYGLSAIHADVATVDAIVDDISANLAAVINNYLGHGTHGLSPIRSALTNIDAIVDDILANVQAIINNYLGHGTHGLSPIRSALTNIDAIVDDILANLVAVINNYLNNATFGLSALNNDLDAIIAALGTVDTEVGNIEAKLDTQKGATGVFYEQADAGISESVDNTEHFVVTLVTGSTRYIVRNLRLKSNDPGVGETITVKLYELINSVETEVNSFVITHDNYGTAHSLVDMWGIPHIAGDSIRVSLTGSAAGPITVLGQMSHAKTNV